MARAKAPSCPYRTPAPAPVEPCPPRPSRLSLLQQRLRSGLLDVLGALAFLAALLGGAWLVDRLGVLESLLAIDAVFVAVGAVLLVLLASAVGLFLLFVRIAGVLRELRARAPAGLMHHGKMRFDPPRHRLGGL